IVPSRVVGAWEKLLFTTSWPFTKSTLPSSLVSSKRCAPAVAAKYRPLQRTCRLSAGAALKGAGKLFGLPPTLPPKLKNGAVVTLLAKSAGGVLSKLAFRFTRVAKLDWRGYWRET